MRHYLLFMSFNFFHFVLQEEDVSAFLDVAAPARATYDR
jgi:hypothetical protein